MILVYAHILTGKTVAAHLLTGEFKITLQKFCHIPGPFGSRPLQGFHFPQPLAVGVFVPAQTILLHILRNGIGNFLHGGTDIFFRPEGVQMPCGTGQKYVPEGFVVQQRMDEICDIITAITRKSNYGVWRCKRILLEVSQMRHIVTVILLTVKKKVCYNFFIP